MAPATCKFQNRFFCVLYMIKRILSLRIILPTQCFVVAVWELRIGINEMVVSRRAFISSSPGDANEARRGKGGGTRVGVLGGRWPQRTSSNLSY